MRYSSMLARTRSRFPSLDKLWTLRDRFYAKPKHIKHQTLTLLTLEDRIVPTGRPLPYPVLYVGSGVGEEPIVRSFDGDTGEVNYTLPVFETEFTGGVNVASADFNADRYPDLVFGAGPGGGPRVQVFDGKTGTQLETPIGSFWAFEEEFTGGVNVAAGDVTGDGRPDVIVAVVSSGGPRVRVFDGVTGEVVADFWAFEEEFTGGVNIAAGDLTLDGRAEILVGAGIGGGPHVRAFDLSGEEPVIAYGFHTDFFADNPEERHGVRVAVGDVNGDHILDVIAAPATGGSPWVRIFNGFDGSMMSEFQAFDVSHTSGLRVSSFYLTDDGYADVVVSSDAEGTGQVRVFDAGTGQLVSGPLADFVPLEGYSGGVRIAAANDPGTMPSVVTVSSDPSSMVSGQSFVVLGVVTQKVTEVLDDPPPPPPPPVVPTGTVTFYLQQSSPSSGNTITLGQAAIEPPPGKMSVPSVARAYLPVDELSLDAGSYSLWTIYSGDSYYAQQTSSKVTITVSANTGVFSTPPVSDGSPITGGVVYPTGSGLNNLSPLSRGGVRVSDGTVAITRDDFATAIQGHSGLLQSWGWTNAPGYSDAAAGSDARLTALPQIEQLNGNNSLAVITSASSAYIFDFFSNDLYSGYRARYNAQAQLTLSSGEFTVTDGRGHTWVFYDFSGGTPAGREGRMISSSTADGTTLTVESWDGSGQPTELQRVTGTGGDAVTESLVTTYVSSGDNEGLIETATLRRKIGTGSWETIRVAEYTYYSNTDNHGRATQLKLAVVKDGSSNVIDTSYYRYYMPGSGTGLLKFAFGPAAYARLTEDLGTSVDTLSDSQVDDFADHYLEYDGSKRVTKHVLAGHGDTPGSGGLGEYTYTYASNTAVQGGANVWKTRMTETMPDGNQYLYYTNASGQVMLEVYKDVTSNAMWRWYNRFDTSGRTVYSGGPSNVTGHDEQYADLVNNQGGNYQYLDDDNGLVTIHSYADTTTATDTTAGDAAGYLVSMAIRQGESGTSVPQQALTYILREDGDDNAFFFPAEVTQFRNDNGTGAQTTSYDYTWFSGTTQAESVTMTLPTVTTAQNGPNTATTATTFFDDLGRPIWSKDQAGFLSYTEYDIATGAVVKIISDVDHTETGDFSDLPSGWTTPGGGGLHLISTYEVDSLGRTTKSTAPNGRVDFTVYNDPGHEVRSYPAWDTSTDAPTGPTTVYRDDRANGYTETLTMSATPALDGNDEPTGGEAITNLESLSRSYRNTASQVTHSDAYFDITSLSYSTSTSLGTQNTHFYRTEQAYTHNGWANRQVSPSGTIYRSEYDGQGRMVSEWVGTDDTPTTGFWSPTNLTGTDMVKVREYEYDNGGVGDGNMTSMTEFPGLGAANRVTESYFDWRNRPVAVKQGVETSESTSVNRPIFYTEYNNLGQAVASERYDGDDEEITFLGGIPERPDAVLLRARSTAEYDELGRGFRSNTFAVDPDTGAVSTYALVSESWYDARGLTIKSTQPGGIVEKSVYDGVGRVLATYVTDGGNDSSYADAGTLTDDIVLEQSEYAYDANGNLLTMLARQRFHDATGTGALGTPSSGIGARVSYAGYYYDLADRTVAIVDVGTNGGSTWSRPGSVPGRSDTVLVSSFEYDSAGRQWKTIDPKGIETRTFYDALDRTTKTIEHYVDGTPSNDDDKTTEYTYGPAGMTSLTAKLAGGGGQTTEWVYGVSISNDSAITSNDIVGATRWPDPSTGSASSGQEETATVNALGQTVTSEDRNGSVHEFTYDVLGRLRMDAVVDLGSGVDDAVLRVEIAFDGQGNTYQVTSYDNESAGDVVNQVLREYNGLGQLIAEYQEHDGVVDGSTLAVEYTYSEMQGGVNHSRLTSIVYPNSRVVSYDYGTGLNESISRLATMKDGATTLEGYSYLGLGIVVERWHPEPGVDLTYIGSPVDAGDQYAGLDRFGRIIDQRWTDGTTDVDRYQYGYDRAGNRTYRENALNTALSEVYSYDGLNQLTGYERGTLNGSKDGITGTVARSQEWDYDALGNWNSVTTDGGSPETRMHNRQNEITAISGATTPTYDANGNMTRDETGKTLIYDAWNRLMEVKDNTTTLVRYGYDGLTRRITSDDGTDVTDLYYSSNWQVLEERVDGDVYASYVWSPIYVDAMVARDRDTDANGTLDERLYPTHDANFNVTALLNTYGAVVERMTYDPFGNLEVRDAVWAIETVSSVEWIHLHQGGRLDVLTGLYHFRYREYSPTLGRWVTMDPIGYIAGDTNLFRSLNNAPISLLDPIGLYLDRGWGWLPYYGSAAAEGLWDGFNDMFVQPVIRTAQAVGDLQAIDPEYKPKNPFVREYLDGERSWHSAVFFMTSDASVVLGWVSAARSVATRVTAQRVTNAAVREADRSRQVIRSKQAGAAGVLRTPDGAVHRGSSNAIRPEGTVVNPPIPVKPGCVEAVTTQAAGAANLKGSYSAVALVGGKRHGTLKQACDQCYPAMKQAGIIDAVRVVQTPLRQFFQNALVWSGFGAAGTIIEDNK